MNRPARTALLTTSVAAAQLALLGVGVAPQLSAHVRGDTYLLEVAPLDPIDPFRGAYVSLDYPGLRESGPTDPAAAPLDHDERGDVYVTLRQEGPVWVADGWTRERPDGVPYLACDDRSWQLRCGIESWFLPEDDARALEDAGQQGRVTARVRVDDRGNAALVGVGAG